MRASRVWPWMLAAIAIGCGARTGLIVEERAAIVPVDAGVDVQPDVPPEVAPDVPPVLDVPPELPPLAVRVSAVRVGGVDLLLVIDDSRSMADKQQELGRRIPALIKALTDPELDPITGKPATPRVLDLHVGVITSSLGAFTATAGECPDDRARLMPRLGSGIGGTGYYVETVSGEPKTAPCPAPVAASVLTWVFDPARDPTAKHSGPEGIRAMQVATSCIVQSIGDRGCGIEQPLEAAYHFLADPAPYANASVSCDFAGNCTPFAISGVDANVLAQRASFLRKDTLLSVVILTDENDDSIRPAGRNWLPLARSPRRMPRAWPGCSKVPDDFDPETAADDAKLRDVYGCRSCDDDPSDPICAVRWPATATNVDSDNAGLRFFSQVQRFGKSFTWPRSRYVAAFSRPTVVGSDGKLAANPIFAGGVRTTDMVVVTAIVGVPKSLVSDATGAPKVLSTAEWDKITSGDLTKRDPHMIESIAPRLGIPKYAGDVSIDPMNGGDRDIEDGDELQYACIAPRKSSDDPGGICAPDDERLRNPICGKDGTQRYMRAYPGLRILRVLRDLGKSGLATSICDDSYAPAVRGLADKLQGVVASECLLTTIAEEPSGEVSCSLYEVFEASTVAGAASCETIGDGYCTPGAAPCRRLGSALPPVSPSIAASSVRIPINVTTKAGTVAEEVVVPFVEGGSVYVVGSDTRRRLVCETKQLVPPATSPESALACRTDPSFELPKGAGGWCFSRDAKIVGDPCLRIGATGQLRFLGNARPRAGSESSLACVRR